MVFSIQIQSNPICSIITIIMLIWPLNFNESSKQNTTHEIIYNANNWAKEQKHEKKIDRKRT